MNYCLSIFVPLYFFLRVYTVLRVIINHTRFRWVHECNGQSEALRWVIAETLVFCSLSARLADWISLSCEFSHHLNKKVQMCVQCKYKRQLHWLSIESFLNCINSHYTDVIGYVFWKCKCSLLVFCSWCLNNWGISRHPYATWLKIYT